MSIDFSLTNVSGSALLQCKEEEEEEEEGLKGCLH